MAKDRDKKHERADVPSLHTAKEKTPLFIYEDNNDAETKTANRKLLIYAVVIIAVCVALYVLGAMLAMQLLILLSLTVAVIAGAILVMLYRRIRKAAQPLNEDEIDQKVEQYKIDLIDTFNGYDVAYTVEDILSAADDYKARLIQEQTSLVDIDPTNFVALMKKMATDSKKSAHERKKLFSKKPAKSKKQTNKS